MNKKILCVIPFSLLAVADGHQEMTPLASHQEVTPIAGCVYRPADPNTPCVNNKGGGTTPFVNVTPNGWVVAPTNVCVTAGDTFEIRFKGPALKLNTLATMPHGNSEFWLIGSNSSDKKIITLTVPAGPNKGDSFDYAILSQSDGCVDPRATYD